MAVHPIVAHMQPSAQQLPAVSARGKDVLVSAGAGSGKTRTLVARYLGLLAEGVAVREIVAVTFTRKAAREMQSRIRREVMGYAADPALTADERAIWQMRVRALDAARIGTIHSLCGELLRAFPAEAGLDPRFEMADEARSALDQVEVIGMQLKTIAEDAALGELFRLYKPSTLTDILAELLGRRGEMQAAFAQLPQDDAALLATWQIRLLARVQRALDTPGIRAAVAELNHTRSMPAVQALLASGEAMSTALARAAPALDALQLAFAHGDWSAVLTHAPLLNLAKNAGKAGDWKLVKPLKEIKDAVGELRDAFDEHIKPLFPTGTTPLADAALARALLLLKRAFSELCEAYADRKAAAGVLDFEDLEAQALALLEDHPGARAASQRGVRALLVDEFQDTNARQLRLLRLLAGERAGVMFMVGDGKQSIYRFRGAEVGVFVRETESARASGVLVDLDTSYRAHAPLVATMNALMGPLMTQRATQVPFAELRAAREIADNAAPHCEVWITAARDKKRALPHAARALVQRLLALKDSLRVPADIGDGTRALRFDDIAILCRAGNSFANYEDALEAAGVPYLAGGSAGFVDRPEVRNVLTLLHAIHDPRDALAEYGALREVFGQSDDVLFQVRFGAQDGAHAAALAQLTSLREHAARASAADVVKRAIDVTGYLAQLVARGERRAARNIDKLLQDAQSAGFTALADFLAWVDLRARSGVREGEARATVDGAVQLLTVHAAKGLEWPVVVLGDVTHQVSIAAGVLVDPGFGLLVPLPDAQGVGRSAVRSVAEAADKQLGADESQRLLYVAVTRARERLIMSAGVGSSDKGLRLDGWLGALSDVGVVPLNDVLATADGDQAHSFLAADDAIAVHVLEGAFALGTLSVPQSAAGAQTAGSALREPLPGPPSVNEDSDTVWRVIPDAAHARAPARVVGTLVHAALASWIFSGEALKLQLRNMLRTIGLTDMARQDDAIRRSLRLLARFKAHPLWAEIDAAELRLHEAPYAVGDDVGRIDLLYKTAAGWTVADFKTDRPRAGTDEHARHRAQIARYRSALEQLLGETPRCLLILLEDAGAVGVLEIE